MMNMNASNEKIVNRVHALLRMTVARGCTAEEERTAKAQAEAIIAKYNLDRAQFANVQEPVRSRASRTQAWDDLYEYMRRAAAEAEERERAYRVRREEEQRRRRQEEEARARAEAERKARESAQTTDGWEKKYEQARDYSRPRMGHSVGKEAVELLKRHPDWSNAQIADEVRARCPGAKTTAASVAWYRSKMRAGKI